MVRKATIVDYITIQGGAPVITQDRGGLFHIVHGYRPDQPEVVTHINPKERGTVILGNVEYQVAKLWQFEGMPCEKKAMSEGGRGYDRKR